MFSVDFNAIFQFNKSYIFVPVSLSGCVLSLGNVFCFCFLKRQNFELVRCCCSLVQSDKCAGKKEIKDQILLVKKSIINILIWKILKHLCTIWQNNPSPVIKHGDLYVIIPIRTTTVAQGRYSQRFPIYCHFLIFFPLSLCKQLKLINGNAYIYCDDILFNLTMAAEKMLFMVMQFNLHLLHQ